MECQIVPARKLELSKPRGKNTKHKNSKCEYAGEDLNDVFTLQPIFKAPKSTLDLENTPNNSKNGFSHSAKKTFDRNKTDLNFNHFTMSRPGALKSPEALPNGNITNSIPGTLSKFQLSNPSRRSTTQGIITSGNNNATGANDKRKSSLQHHRRASSGEELILAAASRRQSRKNSDKTGISYQIGCSGPGGSKSLASSPRPQLVQESQRRKSAGSKISTSQVSKENDEQFKEQALRRKSLFDSHACTKWYSPQRRPVSTERVERSRRNVISPRTLSRLFQTFRQQSGDDGVGDGQLSVCTEDDWKTYGSIFPNRKLVSHKQLIKGSSLPYNDNIGLEETVTLDQARKMAKMQQFKEWKKQQKPSNQTPKQVWYRTVRSVLAVNHLYHRVKAKSQDK
ncbi:hypothetical protein PoB_005111300 [Plakobranchus ocellatus]|uniref:Uncharacterized protein n=1 Tax=Plakobranchus ocellatus TaxID=259542 RepID=A0AAV4BYA3_9GAST|nr:hypothetical protein PoB_005111300 [Plakobranchus ocellatus]